MRVQRLFLDLASQNGLIACVTGDAVAASAEITTRIPDHELLTVTGNVLQEAGWSYDDLTHIACVTGPGGFTSLRVAVTFANVLADQLEVPLVGIHLSDLYRARIGRKGVYWFHSTKKDQLFVRGGKWNEPTLISVDEIPQGTWIGELIPEHRAKVGTDSVPLKSINDVLAAFLVDKSYGKTPLHPWYGRGW